MREAWSRYEARVTVHAPAEEVAKRLPWAARSIEPIDDQRCEYRTSDDDLDWLAMRIAMLGDDYEVHEPPELVERLRHMGERIARGTAGEAVRRHAS
jgi:predicted DNA-binding transcriptional regulator YafY